jgi:hypothetical protein
MNTAYRKNAQNHYWDCEKHLLGWVKVEERADKSMERWSKVVEGANKSDPNFSKVQNFGKGSKLNCV